MGDLYVHNPESKVWLDQMIVFVRSMKRMELHRFLLESRRRFVQYNTKLWPATAEEFAEELEQRELSDLLWETLIAEEYMWQDFQPNETPVVRQLEPEGIEYGPIGFGEEDEEMVGYGMLYRDVQFLYSYQGEDDQGEDEWKISIFFRGQYIRTEIDTVYMNSTE